MNHGMTYGHWLSLARLFDPFDEDVLAAMVQEAKNIIDENAASTPYIDEDSKK